MVFVWFIYDQLKNKASETETQITTDDVDVLVVKTNAVNKKNDSVSLMPRSPGLPEGQLFHENPVIDLFTGINYFAPCHVLFSHDQKDKEQIKNLNSLQKQYLKPFFNACEEEKNQFDVYNKNKIMSKIMTHGLKLKQQQETFNKSPDSFLSYMAQADGYEMIIAFDFTNNYVQSSIIPEIKTQLNIKNDQVLHLVIQEALLLNACQKGVDCSYVSGMMMNRCMEDENACGLNFMEYVNTQYLSGIKQEINVTASFLSDHFGL